MFLVFSREIKSMFQLDKKYSLYSFLSSTLSLLANILITDGTAPTIFINVAMTETSVSAAEQPILPAVICSQVFTLPQNL